MKGGGKFGGRGFRDPTVYVDGKPVGQEFVEEQFYAQQYASANHYQTVLSRHDKTSGTVNNKYLDYEQTMKVNTLIHMLEKKGYSFGDFMDWLALQAVRPSVGQSASSVTNYALQSIFIDVSNHGQNEGLFNRLAAEAIGVCFDFAVECIATKIIEGSPEQIIRKGYDDIINTRSKAYDQEVLDALDDYFDAVETALENAVKSDQSPFAGMTSAKEAAYFQIGKQLGRAAKELSNPKNKAYRDKVVSDPVEAFNFFNQNLESVGIKIESDFINKILQETNQSQALRSENELLKKELAKLTEAGESGSLKDKRHSARSDNISLAT